MEQTLPTIALYATCLGLGILPVLSFLLTLVWLDSYKLVGLRQVLGILACGLGVALVCLVLNTWLIEVFELAPETYSRFAGPAIEELAKVSVVGAALYRRRIGFLVDAAVWGFAIGAGFAAFENSHYFVALAKPGLMLWIVRGFGTAIMHGGATALAAVVTKHLADRFESVMPWIALPGLALAVLVHAAFNHFYLSPALSTLLLLGVLPVLFVLVFRASESSTHRWLGTGFDSDQELLEIINTGQVTGSPMGDYLDDLKTRFPSSTVVDMLCWIRLHLELSIRAKGVLLMRKAGFDVAPDPEVDERLAELGHLERTIGPTGMIALHPIFRMSHRDLWQIHHLRSH